MIIDAHTHISEKGKGGPFGYACSADDLVRGMDSAAIDVSVVLPLHGIASNAFVAEACLQHSDRLVPLYMPDFTKPSETIDIMRRFYEEYSFHGLKIHPRLQGVVVNDSVVCDVMCWAGENHLPVLFDALPYGSDFGNEDMHPYAYCQVCQEMPETVVILAHAGGHKIIDAFLAAKACDNLLLDISFTPAYYSGSSVLKDIQFLLRRLPAGKLIYGSDFPDVGISESLHIAIDLAASLDSERQAALFEKTAVGTYKIPLKG